MNANSKTQDKLKTKEQARRWVIRFESESPPGRKEIEELRAWVQEDPSHLKELKKAEAIWSKASEMTDRLMLSLNTQEGEQPILKQRAHSEKFSSPNIYRAAIIVPLIALCSLLLWTLLPQTSTTNGHHSTGIGQIVALTLEDQSTIHIDSNSEIKVDYSSKQRTITLNKGRALFEVAKDVKRPFIVSTSTGFVRAVGTAFSVSLEERAVKVSVTEGIVDIGRKPSNLNDPDRADQTDVVARLDAGKTAFFDKTTEIISIQTITDIEDSQAWKDGFLVFKGQSLETVVDEILRYTDTEIIIQDPALKSLAIGGRFKTGEIATLLDTLELSFGINVSYLSPKRIRLEADEKSH